MTVEYSEWFDCDSFGLQMWDDITSAVILIICLITIIIICIITRKNFAEQSYGVNRVLRLLFYACIVCAAANVLITMAALSVCPFSKRMMSVLLVSVAPFWYSMYMGILAILLVRVDIMFRGTYVSDILCYMYIVMICGVALLTFIWPLFAFKQIGSIYEISSFTRRIWIVSWTVGFIYVWITCPIFVYYTAKGTLDTTLHIHSFYVTGPIWFALAVWGHAKTYLNLRHLSVNLRKDSIEQMSISMNIAELAGGFQNPTVPGVSLNDRQIQYVLSFYMYSISIVFP